MPRRRRGGRCGVTADSPPRNRSSTNSGSRPTRGIGPRWRAPATSGGGSTACPRTWRSTSSRKAGTGGAAGGGTAAGGAGGRHRGTAQRGERNRRTLLRRGTSRGADARRGAFHRDEGSGAPVRGDRRRAGGACGRHGVQRQPRRGAHGGAGDGGASGAADGGGKTGGERREFRGRRSKVGCAGFVWHR